MLDDVLQRVEKRLKDLGLSATKASKLAGLSEDAIRNLRRAKHSSERQGVTTRTISAIARVLRTSPTWLLEGTGEEEASALERGVVPLVGKVGAGAAATFFSAAQGPFGEVPAPENATRDTVAVEIEGESLGSFFDRWLVYYDDVRRPVTSDLIHKLCVVGLADGRVLIKKLERSKTRGLFHLLSQTEGPIFDAEVDWAARVKTMMPRS